MTENGNKTQNQATAQQGGVATKIDALYNWLSFDLQALKKELLNELKYSSMQSGALYKTMQEEAAKQTKDTASSVQLMVQELKYGYKQNQSIYDDLSGILSDEVVAKLDTTEGKLALLEEIDKQISEIKAKLASFDAQALVDDIRESVIAGIPQVEEVDYDKIGETVAEKAEACALEHSRQVLEAVAAIPVAENIDYSRIVEEVSDKVLEMIQEVAANEEKPVMPEVPEVDYDKIIYGAAEKVVESLPYPEKIDYRRIDDNFKKAAETVKTEVNTDEIVEKILAALDINAIADAVAAKIEVPQVEVPEIDYEKLSDMIAAKIPTPAPVVAESAPVDYDKLAEMVAAKLTPSEESCEVVIDEEGVKEIANGVSAALDIDTIAAKVSEKLSVSESEPASYELLMDEDDVAKIASRVAELVREELKCDAVCVPCEKAEEVAESAEEPVEEVAEVEEIVEEIVETVEEPVVAEEPVEEVREETKEEIAVAIAETIGEDSYEEVNNQLVDAETGLVIRLKRSFTAKMKQSENDVKEYYGKIKNALTSYKRINSNVSWHGDRFNLGRDTIAKMNICGKTLCFYLDLNPDDPEFKTTVYHQKNVGEQKAYENTPFMVKVKSDAAVKKALRLVEALAQSKQAVKDEKFEEVDYKKEFAYETTKQLLNQGLIKITKEKKVELDF